MFLFDIQCYALLSVLQFAMQSTWLVNRFCAICDDLKGSVQDNDLVSAVHKYRIPVLILLSHDR